MAESRSGDLNTTDWKKIGKGALIAAAGAVLTYAAQTIPNINFGEYTVFIAGGAMIVINFLWKLIRG